MRIAALRERLRRLGAAPAHEERVLRRWACAQPQDGGRRRIEHFLPRALRDALPAVAADLDALARVQSTHAGADGSARLLVALADGAAVESVLLPRDGVCVSTQVGCAVGCVFCMTGRGGLQRQLGGAEIVAQVALARSLRPALRRVVFMGMGEPAHNLDEVLDAVELLGTAGGIAHRNLVVSTVGDPRLFERLPQGRVRPSLALSLHTTHAALRAELLPRAPRIAPAELVAAGEAYAQATGHPVQFQWTLIDGVNDGDDEVDAAAALLAGRRAMLNLIPFNTVDGSGFRRPPPGRAEAFAAALRRRGIVATVRQSAGQDVDAGCGQLRARAASAPAPAARAAIPIAVATPG